MDTVTAAIHVLVSLRKIHVHNRARHVLDSAVGVPAILYERAIPRAARSAAFRLLNSKGLLEHRPGGTGGKLWRLSEKGLAVRDGEELSAVS